MLGVIMSMTKSIALRTAACSAALALLLGPARAAPRLAALSDDGKPADIIAVKIRDQGYRCEVPKSVERDKNLSIPNVSVWTLTYANATYGVKLIPDMAAHSERLD